jgi:hypothetical protein
MYYVASERENLDRIANAMERIADVLERLEKQANEEIEQEPKDVPTSS